MGRRRGPLAHTRGSETPLPSRDSYGAGSAGKPAAPRIALATPAGVTAALLALAFVAGVYGLFRLRFESADAYPVYSTLRADPLGAEALYESLALQPGLTVTRNMRPMTRVSGHDTTLFLLGIDEWFAQSTLNVGMAPDLERVARGGGRTVIAFVPQRPRLEAEVAIERQLRGDKKTTPTKHVPTLFEKLGVTLVTETEKRRSEWSADPPRYTALWFDKLAPAWSVQNWYRNHPVWIERPWLAGSIVLVADSWLLSNEALARQPDAVALAQLAGPNHNLVFDERHLGIDEGGSVAGLLRRYHLQGLIAALLVLAGLYVWKSSSPLLPRAATNNAEAAGLRGFSAASGLVTLLERSIAVPQLLDVCIGEYQATAGRGLKLEETMRQSARAADPVRGYKTIRQALEEIRHPWKKTSNS